MVWKERGVGLIVLLVKMCSLGRCRVLGVRTAWEDVGSSGKGLGAAVSSGFELTTKLSRCFCAWFYTVQVRRGFPYFGLLFPCDQVGL